MRPAAALYCLIRYGAGHWMRTAALAAALAREFRVSIAVSGKLLRQSRIQDSVTIAPMPVPADEFMAAPSGDGPPLSAALGEWLERLQPAVFILESYPSAGSTSSSRWRDASTSCGRAQARPCREQRP